MTAGARIAGERDRIAGQIETTSVVWARFIASGDMPGYRTTRDTYRRSRRY